MQAIESPRAAQPETRSLPDAARNRQLQRLVEQRASSAALSALRASTAEGDRIRAAAAELLADGELASNGALELLREFAPSPEFLSLVPGFVRELREIATTHPGTGACTLATAFDLWSWTVKHFRQAGVAGNAIDELAFAVAPMLAARALVREVALDPSDVEFRQDLSRVHSARVAAATGVTCAELVFGYRRHLVWDAEGCAACYASEELDDMEALVPGAACGFSMATDVLEAGGAHPQKAGPCARFDGLDAFMRLRSRLDGCLTGARAAKDRAAATLAATSNMEGNA